MRVTEFTRGALAYRRERRRLEREGWERISENDPLWKFHWGPWLRRRIVEAKVGVDGKTVWIRSSPC